MTPAVNDFFKQQTLVMAEGGHMGAFFINFMMGDHPRYDEYVRKGFYGFVEGNYEWVTKDHFGTVLFYANVASYMIRNIDSPYLNYPYNVKKALVDLGYGMYDLLFLECKFQLSKEDRPSLTLERALELLQEPVSEILHPYARSHPWMRFLESQFTEEETAIIYNSITDYIKAWPGKKVFCTFPKNKQWISSLLDSYKATYYTAKFNRITIGFNYDLHRFTPAGLINFSDTEYLDFPVVDMYKLVFEKDLTDVMRIFPDFVLTEKRKQLLDIAHVAQLNIMDLLEKDHRAVYMDSTQLYNELMQNKFFARYMELLAEGQANGTLRS